MGSVAQRIAENGADYYGLDIAEGPVALVNSRLHEKRLDGRATEGNILNCPHEDCTFDSFQVMRLNSSVHCLLGTLLYNSYTYSSNGCLRVVALTLSKSIRY